MQDSGLCYSSAFFNFSLAQVWNIKWEQVLQCRATWLEYVYVCGQIRDLAIASLPSRSFFSCSPRNGVFGYVKDKNLLYQSLSKAVGIKDRQPSESAPFSHHRKTSKSSAVTRTRTQIFPQLQLDLRGPW